MIHILSADCLESYLESLFGFLRDAAFRGEERRRRRRHCDFWREFGDGGRDEKLWHVGRDTGADSVGVWKLWLLIAGILLLVWEIRKDVNIRAVLFWRFSLCIPLWSFLSHLRFRGSDLAVRCYMWPVLPGTRRPPTPALGIQWSVSSVDKGATPAVGTKVPLRAPPAPLWAKPTQHKHWAFGSFTIFVILHKNTILEL